MGWVENEWSEWKGLFPKIAEPFRTSVFVGTHSITVVLVSNMNEISKWVSGGISLPFWRSASTVLNGICLPNTGSELDKSSIVLVKSTVQCSQHDGCLRLYRRAAQFSSLDLLPTREQ
jgi:hypothetical protein